MHQMQNIFNHELLKNDCHILGIRFQQSLYEFPLIIVFKGTPQSDENIPAIIHPDPISCLNPLKEISSFVKISRLGSKFFGNNSFSK